jgi:hypothetical protein
MFKSHPFSAGIAEMVKYSVENIMVFSSKNPNMPMNASNLYASLALMLLET